MPTLLNSFGFSKTLLQIITDAGLTSNLVLCLDAGDLNSYDGTSQTWTDMSGNSNNFFRGTSVAAQGSDPTFNGVAGNRSANEYFSNDGGDVFTETAAHTFAETWHKNNAAFTFGFVMYASSAMIQSGAGGTAIFQNFQTGVPGAGDVGSYISGLHGTDDLQLEIFNTSGVALSKQLRNGFFPSSAGWLCGIFTVDEAAGTGLIKFSDAAASALSGMTYSSPGSGASAQKYSLMADSDASDGWGSGARLACVFAWNSVLTTGNLDTLYAALKSRFPTLP